MSNDTITQTHVKNLIQKFEIKAIQLAESMRIAAQDSDFVRANTCQTKLKFLHEIIYELRSVLPN